MADQTLKKILITGGCGFTRPHRQRACPPKPSAQADGRRVKLYYTYVLESLKDRKLYIGWTDNLRERLKEHQEGKIFSTKFRLPIRLIYFEACLSKEAAIKREKYFKTGFGRRFLKNRLAGSRGGRVGSN